MAHRRQQHKALQRAVLRYEAKESGMKAADLMSTDLKTVTGTLNVAEAVLTLADAQVYGLPSSRRGQVDSSEFSQLAMSFKRLPNALR